MFYHFCLTMRTRQIGPLSSVARPPGLSLHHLHWLLLTLPADILIEVTKSIYREESKMCFCFTKTLARGAIPLDPLRSGEKKPWRGHGWARRSGPKVRASPWERTCAGVGWGSGCGWQRSGAWGAVFSLPAGINKDDSDPLGGGQDRRGTPRRSWGRKGPPRFEGGRYRPPRFFWIDTSEADL